MKHASWRVGLALLVSAAASGCTTVRQEFPGHRPEHVWTAMKAVAESPEYDDWFVLANEVWIADEEARLEVYREVQRTLHKPRARPRSERRNWRFQILLHEGEPPSASFISRGMGVPAHARHEANRYFADVWRLLGSDRIDQDQRRPAPPTATPDEPDDPVDPDETGAPIDVDDLSQ